MMPFEILCRNLPRLTIYRLSECWARKSPAEQGLVMVGGESKIRTRDHLIKRRQIIENSSLDFAGAIVTIEKWC